MAIEHSNVVGRRKRTWAEWISGIYGGDEGVFGPRATQWRAGPTTTAGYEKFVDAWDEAWTGTKKLVYTDYSGDGESHRHEVDRFLSGLDAMGEIPVPDRPTGRIHKPRVRRFDIAGAAARAVKLRMGGVPTYTRANYLIAWKHVSDELTKLNMRLCDQGPVVAYATELVFIPSEFELNAKELAGHGKCRRLIADYGRERRSLWDWWMGNSVVRPFVRV